MTTQVIGNWSVQSDGIKWIGNEQDNYVIPKDELLSKGVGERSVMYDWLIHTTEKTWVTPNDASKLIVAFIVALKMFNLENDVDATILTNSVIEQQRIISEE